MRGAGMMRSLPLLTAFVAHVLFCTTTLALNQAREDRSQLETLRMYKNLAAAWKDEQEQEASYYENLLNNGVPTASLLAATKTGSAIPKIDVVAVGKEDSRVYYASLGSGEHWLHVNNIRMKSVAMNARYICGIRQYKNVIACRAKGVCGDWIDVPGGEYTKVVLVGDTSALAIDTNKKMIYIPNIATGDGTKPVTPPLGNIRDLSFNQSQGTLCFKIFGNPNTSCARFSDGQASELYLLAEKGKSSEVKLGGNSLYSLVDKKVWYIRPTGSFNLVYGGGMYETIAASGNTLCGLGIDGLVYCQMPLPSGEWTLPTRIDDSPRVFSQLAIVEV